jgi:hypothetical protein
MKHRSCPGTRASRLTRMRRWPRDRRPSLIEPPACNRVKGRALRPALRPRQLKLPAVRRCSQRQNEGKSCLRLETTSEPSLYPTTKLPRWGRTLRPRFLRGATLSPLKVESEPSWLATSSAMSSNPASVGSGGCSSRAETPLRDLFLAVDLRSSEARAAAIRPDPKASPRPDRGARMPDSVDRDKRTICPADLGEDFLRNQ